MSKGRFGLAAVLGAALISTVCATDSRAAVIFFEDFNTGTPATSYTGFANWTVSAGTVDLIGNGYFDFYPGNGNYVDLNGSSGQTGALTSNFLFAAGTYTLSFVLGGSKGGDNGVDLPNVKTTLVTLGNFSQEITLEPLAGLTSQSFTFSTTGGNLIFASLAGGNPNVGNILDNVQVSAVPELSTWMMMLMGFGGLGLWGYRRGRKMTAAHVAT